jgi:aliphatic nitrilase
MGDRLKKLRLAAVQAAPVFLDREASIAKACRLIREAGANNADVIGFPEGFVPSHPGWFNFLPAMSEKALLFSRELFNNSVEVPSAATDELCRACREANVVAVVGINEKLPRTTGTMYNTQLFIDRSGEILGKHQKLVPTNGERIVHAGGDATTMRAFHTHFGAVSGLLCGENSNPLAAFVLATEYPVVHVAGWPAHFEFSHWMLDSIMAATRGLAYQLKAFVINAAAVVDDELIMRYALNDRDAIAVLERYRAAGFASIVGPKGQVVAGPMGAGEGILYADVDLEDVIIPKLIHDFVGHYNRPDVFAVEVRRQQARLVHVADAAQPSDDGAGAERRVQRLLAEGARGLLSAPGADGESTSRD